MPNQNNPHHPPPFIQAMLKPEIYDHHVKACQLIETHISWVILTGNFVYKIKKPDNTYDPFKLYAVINNEDLVVVNYVDIDLILKEPKYFVH